MNGVTGGDGQRRAEMDGDTRVQLTRIEGKLDLVNERHSAMKEDLGTMKLAHADFSRRVDERFHAQGTRLQTLEQQNILQQGQRDGVAKSVKIAWLLSGLGSGGLGCALILHFLHL